MKNDILETIKNSQVRMKPRWHFMARAAFTISGGIILFLLIVYLVSFIIYIEQQSGNHFLISIPWFLISLSIVCIALLERVVCRYAFAYRRPLLYSVLAIVILIGAASGAAVSIRFHERFARYAPGFYDMIKE